MITTEERGSLVMIISDLTVMNRIMNEQAKKIQNREGILWQLLSSEEIDKRTNEYDQMIGDNNKIIEWCIKKLTLEYGE